MANGANLEASDLMWRTPLLIAEEYQHQEIVNFLCQWIAESDHSPTLRTATSLQCDFSQVTTRLFVCLSLFRVGGASSFQSPHSPVLSFFYLYLFLLHVFSYNITPPQFRSTYLSVSTHFHVLITTSSSVFISTWPKLSQSRFSCFLTYVCHTCPCSHFFMHDPLNPLYSHHPSHKSQHVFNVSILNAT